MVFAPGGVAVASCHASRCVTVSGGNLFYEEVVNSIFYQGAATLGEAVLAAKQAVISEHPTNDWLYGPAVLQTILGDPALRLRLPALLPMTLEIAMVGPGMARLSWAAIEGATHYDIYRSASAYIPSSGLLPWTVVAAPDTQLGFSEGLGDWSVDYFFAGKARNQVMTSQLSNIVGEFDQPTEGP
jgi:hypothetical protein